MEMNEARVYRQTTSTTTLTMTTQSPSLEKVRLNGNGEQITLSPLPVSFSFTKSPTTTLLHNGIRHPSSSLGQSFCALSSISWWFPTLPTCSQFCGGQRTTKCVWWGRRRGQWAAAVSPGRNQNLCLDRRLTIAICHKLPERAHNLRMTTQPNKCPAHFSITAKLCTGKKCTNYACPASLPIPIPIAALRSSLHFNFLFDK